jgi:hypothetical protein
VAQALCTLYESASHDPRDAMAPVVVTGGIPIDDVRTAAKARRVRSGLCGVFPLFFVLSLANNTPRGRCGESVCRRVRYRHSLQVAFTQRDPISRPTPTIWDQDARSRRFSHHDRGGVSQRGPKSLETALFAFFPPSRVPSCENIYKITDQAHDPR